MLAKRFEDILHKLEKRRPSMVNFCRCGWSAVNTRSICSRLYSKIQP